MRKDFQRQRVYNWERTVITEGKMDMTLEECQELVTRIFSLFKLEAPTVVFGGHGRATYRGFTINLPRWAHTQFTVIHEATHGILIRKVGSSYKCASHGAEFVRIMIEICWRMGLCEKGQAVRSAQRRGIHVAGLNSMPKMHGVIKQGKVYPKDYYGIMDRRGCPVVVSRAINKWTGMPVRRSKRV